MKSGHSRRENTSSAVGAFPEHEVAKALFSTRANQQVHVRHDRMIVPPFGQGREADASGDALAHSSGLSNRRPCHSRGRWVIVGDAHFRPLSNVHHEPP